MPVEENKGGSLTLPPTYVSVLTIGINPYGRKIKHSGLCQRLEQSNQSYKNRGFQKRSKQARRQGSPVETSAMETDNESAPLMATKRDA